MKQLTLIRHAATDLSGTFCGHIDPCLNHSGAAQVQELINCLLGRNFTAVYSSDLCRAKETAEPIARSGGVPLHLLRGLREIAFGEWEGLRWNELEGRFPCEAQAWIEGYPHCAAPGGEIFDAFQARVMRCIREILDASSGSICIVSHGGVIRLLLTQIFEMDEAEAWRLTREHAKVIDVTITEDHLAGTNKTWRQSRSSGENNEYRNQAW
jgi:broad specificity phosphatase PhoE